MSDNDIFAGLEGIFDEVDEEEVTNVTEMSNSELLNMVEDITHELMHVLGEGRFPRSQEARDLHSLRNACQVELRNRKIPI